MVTPNMANEVNIKIIYGMISANLTILNFTGIMEFGKTYHLHDRGGAEIREQ